VIVDATFHRAVDRSTLAVVAGRIGCPLLFAECRVDDDTARLRLAARAAARLDDVAPALSDADWSVRLGQQRANEPVHAPTPHLVLDMAGDRDAAIERALRGLWAWRREHAMRTPATAGPRV
jgi:predicted kinase